MTRLQHEYVHRVEDKMDQLEVVDGTKVRVLGTAGGPSSTSASSPSPSKESSEGEGGEHRATDRSACDRVGERVAEYAGGRALTHASPPSRL